MPNLSEKCFYNPNLVWINKIPKRFLRAQKFHGREINNMVPSNNTDHSTVVLEGFQEGPSLGPRDAVVSRTVVRLIVVAIRRVII